MSDNLRDRIIKAIGAEVYGDIGNSDLSLATRAADAVIREMGLREEVEILPRRSWRPTNRMHRFVTDWETDE